MLLIMPKHNYSKEYLKLNCLGKHQHKNSISKTSRHLRKTILGNVLVPTQGLIFLTTKSFYMFLMLLSIFVIQNISNINCNTWCNKSNLLLSIRSSSGSWEEKCYPPYPSSIPSTNMFELWIEHIVDKSLNFCEI